MTGDDQPRLEYLKANPKEALVFPKGEFRKVRVNAKRERLLQGEYHFYMTEIARKAHYLQQGLSRMISFKGDKLAIRFSP